MKNKQLFGYLFLLPLILAIWAGWQIFRSNGHRNPDAQVITSIQTAITEMEVMQKENPTQTFKFAGTKYLMTPNVALTFLEKDHKAAKFQALQTTVKKSIAPISLVSALTAILIATLILLKVKGASHTAMKSRDHLLRAFSSTRHLLPLASTGVTVTIALSLAGLLTYESISIWNADFGERMRIKLVVICSLLALASLWLVVKAVFSLPSAWKLFKPDPRPLFGHSLSKAEALGLWQWVEELSNTLGTSPPAHIIAGLNDSFFVTSVSYELKPSGLISEGKLLHLPLSEMSLLSKPETAAIIGHELGHFCGEDTAYSQRFIPIYAGVENSLDAVLKTQKGSDGVGYLLRPAWLLGLWVMDKFHEAVMHWSRIREFAADQVGVKAAGAEAACSALVRVVAVSKPVGETMRTLRSAPEEIGGNFLKSLRSEAHRHGFSDPETFLDQTIAHPTDSHPPTRERIAKMGATLPLSPAFLEHALRRENPAEATWLEPMFTDLQSLVQSLTGTLGEVIQKQEAQFEEELSSIVSVSTESHTFYEKTLLNTILIGGLGLGCIVGGIIAVVNSRLGADPEKLKWIGVGVVVLGLFVTWASRIYIKRGKQPFLEIHQAGFKVPGITELIAWKDVEDVNFAQQKQILTTTIQLLPDTIFQIKKDPLRRTTYQKKRFHLHIIGGKPKGIKVQAYVDLIVAYFNSGRAREIQRIRQDEKAAVKARLQEPTN
jgi:Zn-dependent protease with chaperone function